MLEKCDYYAVVSSGGGQIPARAEPLPLFYVQKIRLCGCFILQLALSLGVFWSLHVLIVCVAIKLHDAQRDNTKQGAVTW